MAATYRITVNNQEPIILTDTMITFAVRKVLVGTDGQAMKSSPTVELDELCFNIADSTLNRVYETLKPQTINNLKIELYSKTSEPEGYFPLVEATGVKLVELQIVDPTEKGHMGYYGEGVAEGSFLLRFTIGYTD